MILTHGINSLPRGGGGGIVNIGGRDFRYVAIGNQLWMAENLDYKFSGCSIGPTGKPSGPAAWYYDGNETDYGIDGPYKCGLLYNGRAARYLNQNLSALGIPTGWHVPTVDEVRELAIAVGGVETGTSAVIRFEGAGTKLKAKDNSATSEFPSGWGGTDDYGFGALPAGSSYRSSSDSSYTDLGFVVAFWTSTEKTSVVNTSFYCNTGTDVILDDMNISAYAYSIRLVKDA